MQLKQSVTMSTGQVLAGTTASTGQVLDGAAAEFDSIQDALDWAHVVLCDPANTLAWTMPDGTVHVLAARHIVGFAFREA